MSDRKLKYALFADLELTCWDSIEPPAGERSEVIEIGIVELDLETFAIGRTFRRLIRPAFSTISPYCTALTGISPKDAKGGRPFAEAANSCRRAFGSAPWHAWGSDGEVLRREAAAHGCETPLPGLEQDLSLFFNQAIGLQRKIGLEEALTLCGLAFEGRPHSALDDAVNTARLFAYLARTMRAAANQFIGDHA